MSERVSERVCEWLRAECVSVLSPVSVSLLYDGTTGTERNSRCW